MAPSLRRAKRFVERDRSGNFLSREKLLWLLLSDSVEVDEVLRPRDALTVELRERRGRAYPGRVWLFLRFAAKREHSNESRLKL